MGFLGALLRPKRAYSAALIDIGAVSVAGAFAHYPEGEIPVIAYARRVPIEVRTDEPRERAMFRALEVLGQSLIKEGAPALARISGSGTISSVLAGVDAPWQETSVRTERFEGDAPFTFTKSLENEALRKVGEAAAGKILCDESIIGITLNGYETKDPYGKKAKRAAIVILASSIDQSVAEGIRSALGNLFHTREVRLASGSALRYQGMRLAFPHDENVLILDATGPVVALSLVRNGFLAAVSDTPDGAVGGPEWAREVSAGLGALAKQFPLPRTILMLVRDSDTDAATASLAGSDLGSHWLSDNPPKIVSVEAKHLSALVKQGGSFPSDLALILMALYARPKA